MPHVAACIEISPFLFLFFSKRHSGSFLFQAVLLLPDPGPLFTVKVYLNAPENIAHIGPIKTRANRLVRISREETCDEGP